MNMEHSKQKLKRTVKDKREKPPTPGTKVWYDKLEEEEEYGEP